MKSMKFSTTIKCSGCLSKTTPFLDELAGHDNWKVDLESPGKILTIAPEAQLSESDVMEAVRKAGYKAVPVL